jgi:hypothetical protein
VHSCSSLNRLCSLLRIARRQASGTGACCTAGSCCSSASGTTAGASSESRGRCGCAGSSSSAGGDGAELREGSGSLGMTGVGRGKWSEEREKQGAVISNWHLIGGEDALVLRALSIHAVSTHAFVALFLCSYSSIQANLVRLDYRRALENRDSIAGCMLSKAWRTCAGCGHVAAPPPYFRASKADKTLCHVARLFSPRIQG